MMKGWRRELPLKRLKSQQVPSEHQKSTELCREEEVLSMAHSRIFDQGRGSWRVQEVDYVVTQD